ncbi:MAG: SLBB domain-containing protein [Candidatus Zipacnadales bacterium]
MTTEYTDRAGSQPFRSLLELEAGELPQREEMMCAWLIDYLWTCSVCLFMGIASAQPESSLTAPLETSATAKYRIQPGDVLAISVDVGMPDYVPPPEVTVGPDGVFAFPSVGEVAAAGKTREEVAATIREALEELYRRVDVTVNVTEYRARHVFVVGEVQKPGPIPVLGASLRLEEAIAQGGGYTAAAAMIVLHRPGQPPREMRVDATEVRDVVLLPGDVVNVAKRRPLMVVGEVEKPGPVELPQEAHLTDALALAGGLTPAADAQHAVLVNHKGHTTIVDLEQLMNAPQGPLNLPLAEYQTLVIAPRRAVAIIGAVQNPGAYPAGHGTRLTQLLATAGGVTAEAAETATVVDEQGQTTQVNLTAALTAPGSESDPLAHTYRTVVVPRVERRVFVMGEVRVPGSISPPFLPVSLVSAIAQAGGVTERADLRNVRIYGEEGQRMTMDIRGLLRPSEDQETGQQAPDGLMMISNNSVIVVPTRQAQVTVLGAVNEPGSYIFGEGDTVVDAIALAGGFAERAAMARVALLRRRGGVVEVTEVNLRAGLQGGRDLLAGPLEDRDVIVVPKGRKTNWAEVAAMLFGLSAVYRNVND